MKQRITRIFLMHSRHSDSALAQTIFQELEKHLWEPEGSFGKIWEDFSRNRRRPYSSIFIREQILMSEILVVSIDAEWVERAESHKEDEALEAIMFAIYYDKLIFLVGDIGTKMPETVLLSGLLNKAGNLSFDLSKINFVDWHDKSNGLISLMKRKAVERDQKELGIIGQTRIADIITCTVFAPHMVKQGGEVLIQCFAHLPEDADIARDLATEFDEAAQRRGFRTLEGQIVRESKITFHLSMPEGIENAEPVQNLVWRGVPEAVQFAMQIPDDYKTGDLIGTVYVSQKGVPFGHIKFKLFVIQYPHSLPTKNSDLNVQWISYKNAFISYASADRNEVLKRVQMLNRLNIEFFQDVVKLEPGDRWEKELYDYIGASDVFFLFWSSAAKQSEWVMKEVQYALNLKSGDDLTPPEIIPIIIEGPPPVTPPPELSHLHFNDPILYFMDE